MLVTELMRGGDLFERLRDIESFDEASAQELAAQIVSAMWVAKDLRAWVETCMAGLQLRTVFCVTTL